LDKRLPGCPKGRIPLASVRFGCSSTLGVRPAATDVMKRTWTIVGTISELSSLE